MAEGLRGGDLSFFTSETSQRLREEGRAEGRVEDTLRVLAARGVELSLEERATIAGCRDLGLLDVWFGRALTARSAAEVLAPVPGE